MWWGYQQQQHAIMPMCVSSTGHCQPVCLLLFADAEYLHDPETAKFEARKQQRAKEKEMLAARAGRAWRPGGQVKSDATKSIIRMNL
jgi:hypothetical protein